MKKIVLSLAVLFTVALVSCGGKKAETADSDSIVADSAVEMVDSASDSAPAADTANADQAPAEVKADSAK